VLAQPSNVHTVVVEPEANALVLGVGPAPVCDGPFVRVRFDWDGPVGAWEVTEPAREPSASGGRGGAGVASTTGAPGARSSIHDLPVGLTVEPLEVPQVARREVTRHVGAAMAVEQSTHDQDAIAAALERAIALAPDDPTLRLAAACAHMARGDAGRALASVRAGLLRETVPYRRGQLLLWGARAALAARDAEAAQAMWDELDRLSGPADELDELRARSRSDRRKPRQWRRRRPDPRLFMLDAH
jgi:hypothetical protein